MQDTIKKTMGGQHCCSKGGAGLAIICIVSLALLVLTCRAGVLTCRAALDSRRDFLKISALSTARCFMPIAFCVRKLQFCSGCMTAVMANNPNASTSPSSSGAVSSLMKLMNCFISTGLARLQSWNSPSNTKVVAMSRRKTLATTTIRLDRILPRHPRRPPPGASL
eukprot:SAG22_NODE_1727_length_3711_cov_8.805925_2_plen_166_part_00